MKGQETIQIDKAVVDKLTDFYIRQVKAFIRTRPSTKYPRGKFFNGKIQNVEVDRVVILDQVEFDKTGFFTEIYFTQIASPNDVEVSRRDD